MITRLAISGYRSLREIRVPLGALNVVTGANGSGKSSLYRALKLLADIAQGRIMQSLAAEGGLQSTLWAGPESFSRAMKAGTQPVQGLVRKNPVSLKLGFSGKDYGYAIDLGLPADSGIFLNDPAIKVESLWTGERLGRANAFAIRTGPFVRIRNDNGEWRGAYHHLATFGRRTTHCVPTGTPRRVTRRSVPIPRCWRATVQILRPPYKPSAKSARLKIWTPPSPMHFPAAGSVWAHPPDF